MVSFEAHRGLLLLQHSTTRLSWVYRSVVETTECGCRAPTGSLENVRCWKTPTNFALKVAALCVGLSVLWAYKNQRKWTTHRGLLFSFPRGPKLSSVQCKPCVAMRRSKDCGQSYEHTNRSTVYFSPQAPQTSYKAATIGHWLGSVMTLAGINTNLTPYPEKDQ